ncbi:hypothetical protein RDABS01_034081 [Bienertia sinuspersici]
MLRTEIKTESRGFTYSDLMNMTSNFQNIIGEGGSGTVYNGCLRDGTPVAVKMLNPSSALSLNLFCTEAELLTRVHHRNLVSLKGHCEEGKIMALVYEHVANGNLRQHLSEKNVNALCWKKRLQIAIEAAQGLEYLHSGCNPPIVHRDFKTSNILLNENFHAKISDFGISKAFSTENTESALVTKVMGTHGYLDPEYHTTQRLHKKSDVYSFRVVLLELITGHPSVIRSTAEAIHVAAWTAPKLESGDIDSIVDERLQGNFNTGSAWKALEIAMVCVSASGIQRPSMNQVLADLNDCLAIENGHETSRYIKKYESQPTPNINDDMAVADTSIEMGPSAR